MRRLLIALFALTLLAACGPKEIGSDCQGGSAENDCVDGALCTHDYSEDPNPPDPPNAERFTCRAVCEIEADCEAGFACRRAEGTMFSTCQPSGLSATSDAGI